MTKRALFSEQTNPDIYLADEGVLGRGVGVRRLVSSYQLRLSGDFDHHCVPHTLDFGP